MSLQQPRKGNSFLKEILWSAEVTKQKKNKSQTSNDFNIDCGSNKINKKTKKKIVTIIMKRISNFPWYKAIKYIFKTTLTNCKMRKESVLNPESSSSCEFLEISSGSWASCCACWKKCQLGCWTYKRFSVWICHILNCMLSHWCITVVD